MQALAADRYGVRQHCAQCLTEVFTSGRPTPSGELLCSPCYSALWGPQASDELRTLVERHSGRAAAGPQIAAAQS
jgi:hypothetical protein